MQEIIPEQVEDQYEKLKANYTTWKGDLQQLDDFLVVGFRVYFRGNVVTDSFFKILRTEKNLLNFLPNI